MTQSTTDGFVVWFTGLPGSGKTTIAKVVEKELKKRGRRVELLDGDEVRSWLSPNEGFSREDRERHLRRVAHVCQLLARNGVVVLASFVSPYRSSREYARKTVEKFVEVYVKCSLETCMRRDPKGLYRKAIEGKVANMTGVQDPYEEPSTSEVFVDTDSLTAEESARVVLKGLATLGYLS